MLNLKIDLKRRQLSLCLYKWYTPKWLDIKCIGLLHRHCIIFNWHLSQMGHCTQVESWDMYQSTQQIWMLCFRSMPTLKTAARMNNLSQTNRTSCPILMNLTYNHTFKFSFNLVWISKLLCRSNCRVKLNCLNTVQHGKVIRAQSDKNNSAKFSIFKGDALWTDIKKANAEALELW